jgi:transposase
VRATTLFNRLLGFKGTVVDSIEFVGSWLVAHVRLRSKLLVCPCGQTSTAAAHAISRRQWRHVNLGRWKVLIEGDIRRVKCRGCRQARAEWVPWARPRSRFTRDFEDLAAWQAARMSKTAVATLMGTSWRSVTLIVDRLVEMHLDEDRLDKLYRIGVDEISYRKGRKFLTVIANHDTGTVVWMGEGRSQTVVGEFFDQLGPERRQQITAVSMDMSTIYRDAVRTHLPGATICFDPFHVIKWAGEALNATYNAANPRAAELNLDDLNPSQAWRRVRHCLRVGQESLDSTGQAIMEQLRKRYPRLHRAWQLKEQLRDLYRSVDPGNAPTHLKKWITRALRSNINSFVALARRIRRNFTGIIAAVQLGLSNSLVEGTNAGIRLIQARAHGYAKLDNLITMIYLCQGGIPLRIPTETS